MTIACRNRAILWSVAILLGLTATQASAEPANWMREAVRATELAWLTKIVGRDAAREFIDNPQIVGGKAAPPGKWPAQVALLQANITDNREAQFCGGALIADQYVLTAAHCIQRDANPSEIEVLLYTQSLANGGIRQPIKRYWRHSEFDGYSPANDIALIELEEAAGIDVEPNWLMSKKQAGKYIVTGEKAFVTGWGWTMSDPLEPTELQEVKVPFVNRDECKDSVASGEINGKMICAGYAEGGKGFCGGDSGGPLVVKHKNQWRLQAGIVSYTMSCKKPGIYGIYTNVSKYKRWIRKRIAE